MSRITGIGGIFFKAADPAKLQDWYKTHLHFDISEWGGRAFMWRDHTNPEEVGRTEWSIMDEKTDYLNPSTKNFMINYRVTDLEKLLATLKAEGVTVVGEMETYPYGKFGWILDPEGQKIELWEPIESGFETSEGQ
jgi:predicted enzyme related to lactoylglutathione lyase